jgi:hypothetical protein
MLLRGKNAPLASPEKEEKVNFYLLLNYSADAARDVCMKKGSKLTFVTVAEVNCQNSFISGINLRPSVFLYFFPLRENSLYLSQSNSKKELFFHNTLSLFTGAQKYRCHNQALNNSGFYFI